jgi:hypothetical protein
MKEWITWGTGSNMCPVPDGTKIEYHTNDSRSKPYTTDFPETLSWGLPYAHSCRIYKYKVVEVKAEISWIPHTTEIIPCHELDEVEYRYRGDLVRANGKTYVAKTLNWKSSGLSHYRVVKAHVQEQPWVKNPGHMPVNRDTMVMYKHPANGDEVRGPISAESIYWTGSCAISDYQIVSQPKSVTIETARLRAPTNSTMSALAEKLSPTKDTQMIVIGILALAIADKNLLNEVSGSSNEALQYAIDAEAEDNKKALGETLRTALKAQKAFKETRRRQMRGWRKATEDNKNELVAIDRAFAYAQETNNFVPWMALLGNNCHQLGLTVEEFDTLSVVPADWTPTAE